MITGQRTDIPAEGLLMALLSELMGQVRCDIRVVIAVRLARNSPTARVVSQAGDGGFLGRRGPRHAAGARKMEISLTGRPAGVS
jgi:hypothetical protein